MEDYFPLSDGVDQAIIMHRDAHFGGKFQWMLEYYRRGGIGISPDFQVQRIEELAAIEEKLGQNLAPMLLSGADAELIGRALATYRELRDLYDDKPLTSPYPLLIADLVLSEEEYPEKEIAAIVTEGSGIVRSLLTVLRSDESHHPLFPGYGRAPQLAALCLGKIGDKRAIAALFESLASEDSEEVERSLKALGQIGEPAKEFLLHVLKRRPFTNDNEYAAMALEQFKNDELVGKICLELLQEKEVLRRYPFSTYLTLNCEGLVSPHKRKEFATLMKNPETPKDLRRDMELIVKQWRSPS